MAGLKDTIVNPRRTICEVHREIYDELENIEGAEHAIELLEEAFDMGKRLVKKLIQYKYSHKHDAIKNFNFAQSLKRRENRGEHGTKG